MLNLVVCKETAGLLKVKEYSETNFLYSVAPVLSIAIFGGMQHE
jgi:hypothetical protein